MGHQLGEILVLYSVITSYSLRPIGRATTIRTRSPAFSLNKTRGQLKSPYQPQNKKGAEKLYCHLQIHTHETRQKGHKQTTNYAKNKKEGSGGWTCKDGKHDCLLSGPFPLTSVPQYALLKNKKQNHKLKHRTLFAFAPLQFKNKLNLRRGFLPRRSGSSKHGNKLFLGWQTIPGNNIKRITHIQASQNLYNIYCVPAAHDTLTNKHTRRTPTLNSCRLTPVEGPKEDRGSTRHPQTIDMRTPHHTEPISL